MHVEKSAIRLDDRTIPLISGEFHYWRNTAEHWPAILAAIREMGLETISTYVPWNYHELAPGQYDFEGTTSTQRDLAGFIDLTAREGFNLIIRPGPYIYSEWPFGGVPERAARLHRLDPDYLAMAEDYMRAVAAVIVPRQVTRGGNIILCQACNEPYPAIESFAEQMGCFAAPGLFKDYLRQRYDNDLDRLNRRWQARFASFDEACVHFHEPCVNTRLPLGDRLLTAPEYRIRYADTMAFVGWYGTEIVRVVAGWLREAGIEVPIFGNGWSPLYQDFAGMSDTVELAGCDVYPMPFFEGDRQTEDDWFYVMDIIKATAAGSRNGNCWSAEFQSGLYPVGTVGYLPPAHFRFMTLAQVARGLRGWNWYMLVSRDNWPHSPINEWGRPNEYFEVHKRLVATARAIEPWRTDELRDASLLLYRPHRVISPGNFEAMYRALEAADIGYDYVDLEAGREPTCDTLIYAGADWLAREDAARLLAFVEDGGTLVCFNVCPVRDEYGEPLEGLSLAAPDGARPVLLPVAVAYRDGVGRITRGGHMGCKVNFGYYREAPGEPVHVRTNATARELLVDIGASASDTFTIGYATACGRGRIVHIASNPCAELLRLVLEQERGLTVQSDEPGVLTNLHKHADGDRLLFVTNRNPDRRRLTVRIDLARAGLEPAAAYAVTADLDGPARRLDGAALASLDVEVAGHDVAWYRIARASPA